MTPTRCYCQAPLRGDGTCPFRCSPDFHPAARRLHRRQESASRRLRETVRRDREHVALSDDEVRRSSTAVSRFDPFYANKRAWAQRGRIGGVR